LAPQVSQLGLVPNQCFIVFATLNTHPERQKFYVIVSPQSHLSCVHSTRRIAQNDVMFTGGSALRTLDRKFGKRLGGAFAYNETGWCVESFTAYQGHNKRFSLGFWEQSGCQNTKSTDTLIL
jgi:hypothetical protein